MTSGPGSGQNVDAVYILQQLKNIIDPLVLELNGIKTEIAAIKDKLPKDK